MITVKVNLYEFIDRRRVGNCEVRARLRVAPRFFRELSDPLLPRPGPMDVIVPDLTLAETITRQGITPDNGSIVFAIDADAAFGRQSNRLHAGRGFLRCAC